MGIFAYIILFYYFCSRVWFSTFVWYNQTTSKYQTYERMKKQEIEIIETALRNLQSALPTVVVKRLTPRNSNTPIVQIGAIAFSCVVRGDVKPSNISGTRAAIQAAETTLPLLLIVSSINPTAFDMLIDEGFALLDMAGNCHIQQQDLLVHIVGKKAEIIDAPHSTRFQVPGVQVLYEILVGEKNQLPSFHALAARTHTSSFTVKRVVDVLIQQGYVFRTEKGYFCKNKELLLDFWTEQYNSVMRSKIQMSRLRWLTSEQDWQTLPLPEFSVWGGECGAYLQNGFLAPASYEIYTTASPGDLIRTGKLAPDPHGEVTVYEAFWSEEGEALSMPKHILYADLINQANSRSIEAAEKIKQELYGNRK